jgi:hypothetical protein
MKKSNEQKNNLLQRLFTSTLSKLTKENGDNRSKSPDDKFKYELPKSFRKAVDYARVRAGYDILPHRHRHRSASPLLRQNLCSSASSSPSPHRSNHRYETVPKFSHSSSTNDIDKVSTKKIQFRRTPHRQVNHAPTPMLFSPRPPFPMMMNPNFMMVNRCRRPPNIVPIRSPVPMQQQQMFQLRFR